MDNVEVRVELTSDFFGDYTHMVEQLNVFKELYGDFTIKQCFDGRDIETFISYYRDAKVLHNEKIQQQIDLLEKQKLEY